MPWVRQRRHCHGETFSAIQQGVVDGLEGSEFTNIATKVYETGKKKVAKTNHFLGVAGVYISTEVWSKIPKQYQNVIESAFKEQAEKQIELLKSKHSGVVKQLEGLGVEFNDIDRKAFEKETVKLFETLPGVNMEMYNSIQSELTKIRQKVK
ncbi:MAG: TRAP transporter substrate-binding protein DctP [Bdellovibrionales bacterium]